MKLFCCSLKYSRTLIQALLPQIQGVFKESHFQGVFKDLAVFQGVFQAVQTMMLPIQGIWQDAVVWICIITLASASSEHFPHETENFAQY